MKTRLLILSLLVAVFVSSCSKDDIDPTNGGSNSGGTKPVYGKTGKATRAYQESFTATSTITPTNTGVFNPGSGSGNATHLGLATISFNQLVTFYNNQPIGSTAAPVNQFYASQLAAVGINNVPDAVSTITYDKSGNSVWFTSTTGTSLSLVSATRVNFTANLNIIGGSGKFEGASGAVVLSGYFNPQSASQSAVMQSSGTITY